MGDDVAEKVQVKAVADHRIHRQRRIRCRQAQGVIAGANADERRVPRASDRPGVDGWRGRWHRWPGP